MQAMENPHEIEQAILLERIIGNVVGLPVLEPTLTHPQVKCNEAVAEMNLCIKVGLLRGTGLVIRCVARVLRCAHTRCARGAAHARNVTRGGVACSMLHRARASIWHVEH